GVVRAEPGGEAERVFRYAEVLVVPARAAGRGAHHPDRLVVDALHFVHAAVLPRRDAQPLGPGIGVALALDADEHRGRGVDVSLRVALLPDFGRAATLDDEKDLLVHVLLGVERARGRDLHDIAAPLGLGAVKLDIVAAAAGALPGRERQVLHFAYADAAEHRDA